MGRDPPRAEQYIIIMIMEVLKIIPMMLVEKSLVKPKKVINKLYAAHSEGNKNI